jgi:CheY-like chemotaxis protein
VVSRLEGDARLPADVQGQLAMMRRNLELEARLIDDMLDLTRIARGKLDLRREAADLNQVVEHALQTIEVPLTTRRLRLITELPGEPVRLWADAPRLTQVFWNLLHNAVKFTPPEGTIRLRSRRESGPDGDFAVVEVTDNGIGIDAEALEQIFDAFHQGRPGTARRFGGLGLGLAISKVIVELHGGELTAESAGKERGSTFMVRLPLREIPPPLPVDTPAPARPGGARSGDLHLLLVEDHVDTAEAMTELLRALGYRVTAAGSVAEGLAVAADLQSRPESAIDLVVSDLGLPDGSGLDLMRELSSRFGLRGISLSGYGMEEDIRSSREAGFERHLIKPTSIQALQAALHELLENA